MRHGGCRQPGTPVGGIEGSDRHVRKSPLFFVDACRKRQMAFVEWKDAPVALPLDQTEGSLPCPE
jgi:hypothetical protein